MLTLVPKSWLSWDFHVMENGRELSLIDRHWFRERASFTLGDSTYDVRRTSAVRGTFVLEHAGAVIAEAVKPSSFRRLFEVSVGSTRYTLRATSAFGRVFSLLRQGMRVGTIRPVSLFRRTATAQFNERIATEVQLFIVFLVLVLWKRAADAAAAGGG